MVKRLPALAPVAVKIISDYVKGPEEYFGAFF